MPSGFNADLRPLGRVRKCPGMGWATPGRFREPDKAAKSDGREHGRHFLEMQKTMLEMKRDGHIDGTEYDHIYPSSTVILSGSLCEKNKYQDKQLQVKPLGVSLE